MPAPNRTSLETIRKEEILQAALTLIAEKGSANVTFDSIAKAAGLSKGGITYYYSSKEALFKEVFQYFFSFVFERAKQEMARQEDPLQRILSYGWLYDPSGFQTKVAFPLLFDVQSMATHDNEYRQAFQDYVVDWVALATEILEEGNASGQFQVESTEETAKLITAIVQGIGTRWNLDRENHSTEWAIKSIGIAVKSILNVRSDPHSQNHGVQRTDTF